MQRFHTGKIDVKHAHSHTSGELVASYNYVVVGSTECALGLHLAPKILDYVGIGDEVCPPLFG